MRQAALAMPSSVLQAPDTARAGALADWDAGRKGLWTMSSTAMLAVHAGALAVAVLWHPGFHDAAPPPAAMMIELAPMAAPPAPPSDMAPGVEQQAARPLEQKIEEQPKPEPVKKAEVELPKPKPKPKPMVKPPVEAPTAEKVIEQTTAPVAAEAPPSPRMAAPAMAAPSSAPSNALPTWRGALVAHLQRYKRYPAAAQFRRQEGISTVRFVMDREGKVLSARLERGCGFSRLDDEALALLDRAQPLPLPPPEIEGDRIELVVPIQFNLR